MEADGAARASTVLGEGRAPAGGDAVLRRLQCRRAPAEDARVGATPVQSDHTYFVGPLGTWVHNRCGFQRHHIFPQEYADEFEQLGINVHDHTLELDDATHIGVHSQGWNAEWGEFLEGNPTGEQAVQKAIDMTNDYGIADAPYMPYQ